MNPIPITWCLAGAGAAALLSAWGGWTVRDWKRDSEVLAGMEKATEQVENQRKVIDDAAQAYEQERQDAGIQTRVRESTIREIYKDRPVSADCAVPDAARSVLDSAVDAANARAAGQPATSLPAAGQAASAAQ